MLTTIIIFTISIYWLLRETDYMRIHLLVGKLPIVIDTYSEYYNTLLSNIEKHTIELKRNSIIFSPLDMPDSKGTLNILCQIQADGITQVKVLRENLVKSLSSIKSDNVSICDIIIARQTLLEALKIQTECNIVNVQYGTVSGYTKEPETCIQFTCDRTKMRFLNHKVITRKNNGDIKAINFVESIKSLNKKTGTIIDSQELLKAINFVLPCVAKEEYARPYLRCMLFQCDNDTINLTSADAYRLGKTSVQAKGINQGNILIEYDDIQRVVKFLKTVNVSGTGRNKEYEPIGLTFNEQTVTFTSASNKLEINNQDYKYPEYDKLIPQSGSKITFIASELLQATKALHSIAKDSSNIIRLNFSQDKITLSAKSEEVGNSTTECNAKVELDGCIAFNTSYLMQFLKLCKNDIVTMLYKDKSSTALFTLNETHQYIIMPMGVQWEDGKHEDTPEIEPEEIEVDNTEDFSLEELEGVLAD